MRLITIVLMMLLTVGCMAGKTTTQFVNGDVETAYKFGLLSMQIEKKHATLRSDKGVGFSLKFTDSTNPLPTLKFGYWGTFQTFTPMVEATFDADGKITAKEALPSTLLQFTSDPIAGKAADDISATGTAAQNITIKPVTESVERMITPMEEVGESIDAPAESIEDWANE